MAKNRRIHLTQRIRIQGLPQPHKPRNSRRKKTQPQLRRTKNKILRHTKETNRIRTARAQPFLSAIFTEDKELLELIHLLLLNSYN